MQSKSVRIQIQLFYPVKIQHRIPARFPLYPESEIPPLTSGAIPQIQCDLSRKKPPMQSISGFWCARRDLNPHARNEH